VLALSPLSSRSAKTLRDLAIANFAFAWQDAVIAFERTLGALRQRAGALLAELAPPSASG